MTKEQFKSNNGDTLANLNQIKLNAEWEFDLARRDLRNAELALAPFQKRVARFESEVSNASCRLNVWWTEFKRAAKPKKKGK